MCIGYHTRRYTIRLGSTSDTLHLYGTGTSRFQSSQGEEQPITNEQQRPLHCTTNNIWNYRKRRFAVELSVSLHSLCVRNHVVDYLMYIISPSGRYDFICGLNDIRRGIHHAPANMHYNLAHTTAAELLRSPVLPRRYISGQVDVAHACLT